MNFLLHQNHNHNHYWQRPYYDQYHPINIDIKRIMNIIIQWKILKMTRNFVAWSRGNIVCQMATEIMQRSITRPLISLDIMTNKVFSRLSTMIKNKIITNKIVMQGKINKITITITITITMYFVCLRRNPICTVTV